MDIDGIPIGLVITGLFVPLTMYLIIAGMIDFTDYQGAIIYAGLMGINFFGIIITTLTDWMIPIPTRHFQISGRIDNNGR